MTRHRSLLVCALSLAVLSSLIVMTPAPAAAQPAGYPVGGIDISSNDHLRYPIEWAAEVARGTRFAYVKATEGTSYANPYFHGDYGAARSAGLYVGAYVFARPDRGNPVGQADFFLSHAEWTRDAKTLVPFVDLEWPYSGIHTDSCYDLSPAQLTGFIHAFLDELEARLGRPPMIYTNSNWWNPCTGNDRSFGRYPVDLASYTTTPPRLPAGWTTFTIWQYAPGDVSIDGDYDRDVVNGGEAD